MAVLVLAINVNIIGSITTGKVGPEKEDTYQEGLLVANWAKILNTEPRSHF